MTTQPIENEAGKREAIAAKEELDLDAVYETGLQWGRVRRMTHPKMRPYIIAAKGEVQVIDLAQTVAALKRAAEFLRELALEDGASMLFVGIQPAARFLVAERARRLGLPYVNERWLGGTLTNLKTLAARTQYLKDLEQKIASEEFASYTKKERLKMQREVEELRRKFEGLRNMSKLPSAVVLIGVRRHEAALKEARRMSIPVIAIVNTSDDPAEVKFPIPGNDNSVPGIEFVLNEIERAWVGNEKIEKKE